MCAKKRVPSREEKLELGGVEYADDVILTTAEYEKLKEKVGAHHITPLIEHFSNSKGAHGYEYISDYKAILSWGISSYSRSIERSVVLPPARTAHASAKVFRAPKEDREKLQAMKIGDILAKVTKNG